MYSSVVRPHEFMAHTCSGSPLLWMKHLHSSFIGFLLEGPLFPFAKSLNKMCVIILTLFMCQNSSLQFLQVHTKSGSLGFTENWITNSQVSVSCWLTCSHSQALAKFVFLEISSKCTWPILLGTNMPVRQVYIPQIVCLPKKKLIYMSHKKRSPNHAQQ